MQLVTFLGLDIWQGIIFLLEKSQGKNVIFI